MIKENFKIKSFSPKTIETIGYYVYGLRYPTQKKYFYIGKGKNNRVFQHILNAKKFPNNKSEKLDTIRQILRSGSYPAIDIIMHKLTEKEAFKIESALIDVVGREQLTNQVKGHFYDDVGLMSAKNVNDLYKGIKFTTTLPMIGIKINRTWYRSMPASELYERTRGSWVLGKRREKTVYALSLCFGIVRQIYEIRYWEKAPEKSRWSFAGPIAKDLERYIGATVNHMPNSKGQNPIFYINC